MVWGKNTPKKENPNKEWIRIETKMEAAVRRNDKKAYYKYRSQLIQLGQT